jgi:hypothetical protein
MTPIVIRGLKMFGVFWNPNETKSTQFSQYFGSTSYDIELRVLVVRQ